MTQNTMTDEQQRALDEIVRRNTRVGNCWDIPDFIDTDAIAQEAFDLGRALLSQQRSEVPAGYAQVPLRLTPEMEAVIREEDWQWEDLLAAAEAITEQEYNELAAAPQPSPKHDDDYDIFDDPTGDNGDWIHDPDMGAR